MPLLDLTFSDLYVSGEPASSSYKMTPDARQMRPVPEEYAAELAELREHCLDLHSQHGHGRRHSGFSVDWPTDDPVGRMRVKPLRTAHESPLFVCRRLGRAPAGLIQLGFPPKVVEELLKNPVQDGLILFMGAIGSGKTTAAGAFLIETILKHGGVGLTIEAPIELDLEGPYGDGMILQTEVESETEMGEVLREEMLRSSANLLLVGEIKAKVTAAEAATLSNTGHPVVSTYHAPDIPTGLARYARDMGNDLDAFADALSAVFHLKLTHFEQMRSQAPATTEPIPGKLTPPKKLLTVSPLIIPRDDTRLRSQLRGGEFHQLNSEIQRQRGQFLNNRSI